MLTSKREAFVSYFRLISWKRHNICEHSAVFTLVNILRTTWNDNASSRLKIWFTNMRQAQQQQWIQLVKTLHKLLTMWARKWPKGPNSFKLWIKAWEFCPFLRGKEDAFGTSWSRVGKGKRLMGRRVLHRCFHLPPYLDYSDKSCQRIAIFATKLKGWWEKGNVWKCRNAGSLLTASSQLLMEPHGDLRKSENKRRL